MKKPEPAPWVPWAYINDNGQPVTRDLLPALFVEVVVPARGIILRAMHGPQPRKN